MSNQQFKGFVDALPITIIFVMALIEAHSVFDFLLALMVWLGYMQLTLRVKSYDPTQEKEEAA